MNNKTIMDSYLNWVKGEVNVQEFDKYYEIIMPYLNRFNDYIQVYIKQDKNGKITLTDNGYIVSNLISLGVIITPNSIQAEILDRILHRFSMSLKCDEIIKSTNKKDLARDLHLTVQAFALIDNTFEYLFYKTFGGK